jgi:hypothetical protein
VLEEPGANGFKYVDADTTSTGLLKLLLKPGSGTAKIIAKARGEHLTLPGMPPDAAHRAGARPSGACWEHGYDSTGVVRSDATQFKAHGG